MISVDYFEEVFFCKAIKQMRRPLKLLSFYAIQSDKQLITNRHEMPICQNRLCIESDPMRSDAE